MFKLRTLLKDATITEFKQWQKCFKAYFKQSKMATGNAILQRSFLDTCIVDDLARIIDKETESTNPITYSGGAHASTMGILDKHFDKP